MFLRCFMISSSSLQQASDAILVSGLELSSQIGVPDAERAEAQRLTLNLVLLPSSPLSYTVGPLNRVRK